MQNINNNSYKLHTYLINKNVSDNTERNITDLNMCQDIIRHLNTYLYTSVVSIECMKADITIIFDIVKLASSLF